jgi:hypothetical protein
MGKKSTVPTRAQQRAHTGDEGSRAGRLDALEAPSGRILPVGVNACGAKFIARVSIGGKQVHLGTFEYGRGSSGSLRGGKAYRADIARRSILRPDGRD